MTSEHTPGPWRIRTNRAHDPVECDLTICGDIFALADINGPNYAHCEPNARLIAAAPDLLAACKRAFGGMRDHEGSEYMRAAIENATGESCE
jgi:hypothetical protein